jgi:uncharacterized membrane protein
MGKKTKLVLCQICGKEKTPDEVMPAGIVRPSIVRTIKKKHPQWSPEGFICSDDLAQIKKDYVEDVLQEEMGELSRLEKEVLTSLKEHELLAKNVNTEFERKLRPGERVSDKVAEIGGSWRFVIGFVIIIAIWISLNSLLLMRRPFDPYPYILLNLILSCVAALQAPVIMMSQRRQEERDRMRAENDYRINLKAELEIRHLHEKIDHLLVSQWQKMMEIQKIEIDEMQDLAHKTGGKRRK